MTLCKVLCKKEVDEFPAQADGRTQEILRWQNNYYLRSTVIFS